MKKAVASAAKSAAVGGHGARVLYGESNQSELTKGAQVFKRAGYEVETASGRAALEQALRSGHFDVVVLGHTLTKDDRYHLPYMAKKFNSSIKVLVLHASGRHPAVDVALDSRDGDDVVLHALGTLAEESSLAVA
jgi:DNA-binding NtrC family response regulator